MEINIRAREPQDAAAYQRLYCHPDVYPWTLQLPFPSVATWEKKIARMDAEGFIAFVAEIEGVLAGELTLFVDNKPRTRHCISFGLGVHPDYAGRGVGERLIRTALDYSRNWLGITRMELEVFHDNERALRLYERLGFEREGVMRQAALRDGQLRDVVMMAKLLHGKS
ncbi:GNAT family N-acetyltransferase [Pantoea agglomerans]|uniref:GNAT family N-acetyltransferase n=1 Tax=Enterobacter agglomerans TaxID=549 RepID=UPI0018784961|nr:GNAT family N-acetyltransferase [Pantoea agglomerans]MBE5681292.1 GNAT family N-acetyltransferase [Pantoea agglomerans]